MCAHLQQFPLTAGAIHWQWPSRPDMDLIVFDLDGTLLNRHSALSEGTRETLRRLSRVAASPTPSPPAEPCTRRERCWKGSDFKLPHIYKNGVMIWRPDTGRYSHSNLLSMHEIRHIVEGFICPGRYAVHFHRRATGSPRRLPPAAADPGGTPARGAFAQA